MTAGQSSPPRGPGQRAGLAAPDILSAARALLGEGGRDGLTMRRLADRLGVAPNTIYSHFADKAALLEALVDGLMAEIELPDPDAGDWRAGLAELMTGSRRLVLAHADLIPLFLAQPGRGPNALHLGEVTLALLERGGVRGPRAVEALRILLVYTLGFAAQEAPRRADPDPAGRRAASEAAMRDAPERPRVRRMAGPLARHPDDETFATGLGWLLAGIAAPS